MPDGWILGGPNFNFPGFPRSGTPNEAQTGDDLIWKLLHRHGRVDFLRQRNPAARGRYDVPDGLMFENGAIKGEANSVGAERCPVLIAVD